MTKSSTRRLDFDSLETMVLLSTVFAEAIHVPKNASQVAPITSLTLSGSGQTTLRFTPYTFSTTTLTSGGSAQLRSIGHVSVKMAEDFQGITPSIKLTLSAKQGRINLLGHLADPQSVAPTIDYTITGGTGLYARATGSGVIVGSAPHVKGLAATTFLTFD